MSFIAKNPLSLPEIDYTPSTPLKGTRGLYPKEDGWYDIDDNGNEKKILDSDDKNDIDRVGQKTENNGEIFNDYDNNIASANNSHAEGYKSEAQNDCAHAENNATIASGYGSHSEGNNTHASGNYSHAEGTRSVAKGEASHAEGLKTIASSNNSHAQGENTNAGTKAFKIASSFTNDGSGTIKFNLNSSEGLNDNLIGTPCTLRVANEFSNGITISGYDTTASTITLKGVPADATYETDSDDASTHTVENFIVIQGHPELGDTDVGHNAHAGGYNTLAQGRETFAAGRDNKVVGQYGAVTGRENIVGHGAFASGRKNTALGTMSHAEGSETKAIGSCAHAEGKNTESYGTYSHAEGSYTKAHGDFTHSEGYRSTASGEASHAEGGDTTAEGNYSHAEGYSSYAKGINTHSEGNNTYAEGSASHAEGTDSQSVGQSSHAEGRGTLANGTNSHSEGNSTEARGNHSHAEGVKSRTGNADNTGGYAAHAEGNETEATGSSSHSEGNQTHATASCSHAEGNNTYATGSASHAEGAYTIAASSYQHVQGKYNVVDSEGTYAHIIGNGTGNADDQRKNIHTVDWDGNAWFAGEITVGEDKKKLVTEDEINNDLVITGNATISEQREERYILAFSDMSATFDEIYAAYNDGKTIKFTGSLNGENGIAYLTEIDENQAIFSFVNREQYQILAFCDSAGWSGMIMPLVIETIFEADIDNITGNRICKVEGMSSGLLIQSVALLFLNGVKITTYSQMLITSTTIKRRSKTNDEGWSEWTENIVGDTTDLTDIKELIAAKPDRETVYTKDEIDALISTGGAATSFSSIILNSSTEGSTKQFKITIDDNGKLTAIAVEVNE